MEWEPAEPDETPEQAQQHPEPADDRSSKPTPDDDVSSPPEPDEEKEPRQSVDFDPPVVIE